MTASGPPDGQAWLFCYGTLLDDARWRSVVGAEAPRLEPAVLRQHRRFQVPGRDYPAAVAHSGHSVSGGVRQVLRAEDWSALDRYEGSEYRRVPCSVEVQSRQLRAQVYLYDLESELSVEPLQQQRGWLPCVARWLHGSSAWLHGDEPLAALETRLHQRLATGGSLQIIVAACSGEPVGAVQLLDQPVGRFPDAALWLADVYVRPDLRGIGIGARLLRHVLARAQALGVERVGLVCAAENEGFYRTLGFSTLEHRARLGQSVALMQRMISV